MEGSGGHQMDALEMKLQVAVNYLIGVQTPNLGPLQKLCCSESLGSLSSSHFNLFYMKR